MEWINLTDRLPQNEEHVIGYCKIKHVDAFQVLPVLFQITDNGEIQWAYLTAYNEGYGYVEEIKCWMTLPNPPEENEQKI